MSFSVSKMNISPETRIFSFSETLLSPLSSLARTALDAISNIGALFSEKTIFSQAEEAEIQRVRQSLLSSPEQNKLDSLTQNYTKKNQRILLRPFSDQTHDSSSRSPRRISFNETPQVWDFGKDQSPSPQPRQPSPQHGNLKSILKRRLNFSEVD